MFFLYILLLLLLLLLTYIEKDAFFSVLYPIQRCTTMAYVKEILTSGGGNKMEISDINEEITYNQGK